MKTDEQAKMEAAELEFLQAAEDPETSSSPRPPALGPRPAKRREPEPWTMMDVAVAFRQGLKWVAEVRRQMELKGYAWADDASDIPLVERWLARNPDFACDQGEALAVKEVGAHFRKGRTWAQGLKKAMEEAGWEWRMGMVELARVEMFLGHYRAQEGHDFGVSRVYASRRVKKKSLNNNELQEK